MPEHDNPICPVCSEAVEAEDGKFEGDVLYHYGCVPSDVED